MDTAQNKMGTMHEGRLLLSMGVPLMVSMLVTALYNIVDTFFVLRLDGVGEAAATALALAFPMQMLMTALNVVLDPIFIFGLCGVPAMGVAGAAIATVIGQCCAIVITGTLHFRKDREMDFSLLNLRPDKAILGRIMRVGIPAILMQGLTSVMTLGMNFILAGLSASAVTAYGIYYKLQNFIFMPAFGINNACVPLIGYNLGAGNMRRIKNTIRYAAIMVLVIMAAGTALFQVFAGELVGVFGLSEDFTRLCVTAIRIITCGFLFAGLNVLLQGVCQAMGGGVQSLVISLLRLVVLVLPLAFLLARLPGAEHLVWLAFPLAEAASFAAAVYLTVRLYRRTRDGLNK